MWHGEATITYENGDVKETIFNRGVQEMYEKRSNDEDGWAFEKTGVFSGADG